MHDITHQLQTFNWECFALHLFALGWISASESNQSNNQIPCFLQQIPTSHSETTGSTPGVESKYTFTRKGSTITCQAIAAAASKCAAVGGCQTEVAAAARAVARLDPIRPSVSHLQAAVGNFPRSAASLREYNTSSCSPEPAATRRAAKTAGGSNGPAPHLRSREWVVQ
jgi:hypothetical protein